MRRIPTLVLAFALMAAACSSGATQVEASGSGDPDPAPEPLDTVPGTRPLDTTPGTESLDTVPGTAPPQAVVLDRETALLREDDVDGDWQPPSTSASDGWDIGPNQTDCDVYWELESIATHPSSRRLWFQPGANLNHAVHDAAPEVADRLLAAAARLADECPSLSWDEGGTNSISPLPIETDGAVAFEVFDQTGETTWHAYAGRGNLVSRLWRVHFEPGSQPSGDAFAEFERLVATMVDRLDRAQPLVFATTTTSPVATTMPPESTTTWTPSTSPPSTSPPSTTTTTLEPETLDDHPLIGLLLSGPQLPAGLEADETMQAIPSDPEDQLLEGCDASQAVVTLDEWFSLQRSFRGDDGLEVLQIVGRAPSVEAAAAAITEFGLVGECDPPPEGEFENAVFSSRPLEGVEGATAVWLEIRSELFAVRFAAYHVGDLVGVVILSRTESTQMAALDLHRELAQAAVDLAG